MVNKLKSLNNYRKSIRGNIMKKFIAILLATLLAVSNLFSLTAYAENSEKIIVVDGKKITVSSSRGVVSAKVVEGTNSYELIHKRFTDNFIVNERNLLQRSIDIDSYKIDFKRLTTDEVDVESIRDSLGKVKTISKYESRSAIAIGLGWLTLSALGKALAMAAGVVVIAGVTYYAISALSTLLRENSHIDYYEGFLHNNNLYIGTPIYSQSQATNYLRNYKNIIARNRDYAQRAAMSASPIGKISHHHRHISNAGYLPHYHYHKTFNEIARHVHAFYK